MVIGAMQENNGGGTPTQADLESWNSQYGVEHPMLADPAGTQMGYYAAGFPTYAIIDRDMVIQNADLWPFDTSYVIGLL